MTSKPAMPRAIKLSYFDFHGGRGEDARIALSIAGIPFEDDRVARADWPSRKPGTPFGGLPVLEVDGKVVSQSNAINRYVGTLAGLYPDDALQAARCDEISDAVESLYGTVSPSFAMTGEEQKRERERLIAGPIRSYLNTFAKMLDEGAGEWFVGGKLSMADLKVSEVVRMFGAGRLDHVPTDLVRQVAPTLEALRARVLAHPGVAAYYARVRK